MGTSALVGSGCEELPLAVVIPEGVDVEEEEEEEADDDDVAPMLVMLLCHEKT